MVNEKETKFERIEVLLKRLDDDFSSSEVATWALKSQASEAELDAIISFLEAIDNKENEASVRSLKKRSGLPKHDEKSFENFDTSCLTKEGIEALNSLKTLSFLTAKKNVILVGNVGNGKTHIAEAIGYKCCEARNATYFITANEFKSKVERATKLGTKTNLIKNLARYTCLIIDEVGHDTFNKIETQVLFQVVNSFEIKDKGSIVITTNKDLDKWDEFFEDKDSLENLLDKLEDKAICLHFTGSSYRGKERKVVKMNRENVVLSLGN